jgi:hypothetical protein
MVAQLRGNVFELFSIVPDLIEEVNVSGGDQRIVHPVGSKPHPRMALLPYLRFP